MLCWLVAVAKAAAMLLLALLVRLRLSESIVWTDAVPVDSPSPVKSMTAQSGLDSPANQVGGILPSEGGVRYV